ncbi:helix-turn-helix domain-containing protein [Bacillus sp. REN16]|uniref:helix-turn-helix domain-containing protein n=1 Tax=Bacillus sp. REN16 TaxID=2887296 RepID=UPI001E564660|nr:helix-turn-helix domain-containing protein [Bacillus sp. REN16]MCC3355746.1 helix-turn-helix domain-containing protein [Bacillus sp. REN16]
MDKEQLTQTLSEKMKLIRIEKGYTQDKMAEILGISKKTLVQIEKGRIQAGWTCIVAVCALFRDSEIIQSILGEDPVDVIEIIGRNGIDRAKERTLGGKVWWKDLKKEGRFRLQQNMISQHYRILDDSNFRWYSSFEKEEAYNRLKEISIEPN